MSTVLYSASGNNATLQGTSVGGSKPLHRFIKGQPKTIGTAVLVLGSSFFIVSIASAESSGNDFTFAIIPPGVIQGILFMSCGILYIVTEHNPTKKTVTISLALSIVTILTCSWNVLNILPYIIHYHHFRYMEIYDENSTEPVDLWPSHLEGMEISMESLVVSYSLAGGIILIVMSVLAGAALRSTKNQAIVRVTASSPEALSE